MDCVIIAGGQPGPDDPLYPYTGDKPKALIDMCGRPMLAYVVDALQGSRYVNDIMIVGLGSDMGMQFKRPVYHLPDQGSLVSNAIAGLEWARQRKPGVNAVLTCSADIPTLTSGIVDEFVESCQPFDYGLYYTFVTEETFERRFPGSNRTFVKLKDARVAGGDLTIMDPDLVDVNRDLWEALAHGRKHAWQLARIVGLRFLLKFLLHQLSLADIEVTAGRIIGKPVRALISPHAELAMDGDKPHQIDLLRADLQRQTAAA